MTKFIVQRRNAFSCFLGDVPAIPLQAFNQPLAFLIYIDARKHLLRPVYPLLDRDVWHLVNNPAKAQKLLEILFDLIKVDEVQLSVRREGWSEDKYEIMHINISAWFQDSGGLCRHVNDFIVSGIKFAHRNQAEQFKEHMDKRLMWARLGGGKFQ